MPPTKSKFWPSRLFRKKKRDRGAAYCGEEVEVEPDKVSKGGHVSFANGTVENGRGVMFPLPEPVSNQQQQKEQEVAQPATPPMLSGKARKTSPYSITASPASPRALDSADPTGDRAMIGGKRPSISETVAGKISLVLCHVSVHLHMHHPLPQDIAAEDKIPYTPLRLRQKWQAVHTWLDPSTGELVFSALDFTLGCREIGKIYGQFGRGAGVITEDINDKCNVLLDMLCEERLKGITLHALVRDEVCKKAAFRRRSGAWAAVWLFRFITYVEFFVRELLNPNNKQSAGDIAVEGYNTNLKPYHPWLARKLAPSLLRLVPGKNKLLEFLQIVDPTSREQFCEFQVLLRPVIESLGKLLDELNLKDFAAHKYKEPPP